MAQDPAIADILADPTPTPQPQIPVADPAQVAPAPAPMPAPQAQPSPTVPLAEHLEERHRRQALEREAAAYRQMLLGAQQRPQQPPPPPIDPVADPEGAYRALVQHTAAQDQRMQDMAINQRANMSEMLARGKHGDQVVDQAIQAAINAGLNRNFMMQADPYKELMNWHNSQNIAQTVGSDLNAYREKIRQEILAEMKVGRPAPTNLPPSLATATRANSAPDVIPEAGDFFKSMFAKPQRTT